MSTEKIRFESLKQPTLQPTSDGNWLGDFSGFPPPRGHPGVADRTARQANPPPHMRKNRHYVGVRFWPEKSSDGRLFNIVCFVCGLEWNGKWYVIENEVRPGVLGSGSVFRDGHLLGCQCVMGLSSKYTEPIRDEDIDVILEENLALALQGKSIVESGDP